MQAYPDVVAVIANDYLDRVKAKLHAVPAREQVEFLREIESHMFEAYRQTPGDGDVARMLAVLRKLGEPGDVVADRLPAAMVRSGTDRSVPLHIAAGILIALFGIPLGFGGIAVLIGILVALSGLVIGYYAAAAGLLVTAAAFAAAGLVRIYATAVWDRMISAELIKFDYKVAQVLEPMSAVEQGVLFLVIGGLFLAAGVAMVWGGRYVIRGLRFLYALAFDSVRRIAQSLRRKAGNVRADGSVLNSVFGSFNAKRPIPL